MFERGRPRVIEDGKGYKVLPSVVYQKDDGSFVVGQAAKSHILTSPDRTVYAVKRLIGRRFESGQAQAARQRMPYGIEASPDGGCLVKLGDQLLSPVEVSAIILQVARKIAEETTGEEVTDAVITVPAYFNHSQRQATMEAAELAGLRCERLLNEPTAAALAYGFRQDVDKNVLIFDLGGGTFDVSILHLSDGVYEVLATGGDTFLGGEDFDDRIVEYLADRFMAEHRIDLRGDRVARQRLKDAAERAKCELSFTSETRLLIPRITPQLNLEDSLSRSDLEGLTEDLVQRTLEVARSVLGDSGLGLSEIDDIVLVGGQTRMPRIREAISAFFRKEPSKTVHPEEVVALGASVHAESLDAPSQMRTLLIDVTPFDLGIDAAGGYFSTIINRNTRIPFTASRAFTTANENQKNARITVRQGASNRATENERLGEFLLEELGSGARMERKVDVTFRIDANGILHTSAVDRASGKRKSLSIENYSQAAKSPTFPPPEEEQEGDKEIKAETAATGKKTGLLEGLFASFGRKAQDAKRMELQVPEDAPMPERSAPLPETSAEDKAPISTELAYDEPTDDPISLTVDDMEMLPEQAMEEVEDVEAMLEMLPEDSELGGFQMPVIQLGEAPPFLDDDEDVEDPVTERPRIDLPGGLDTDLAALEGLDPFEEADSYPASEPLPEIPDLPLPEITSPPPNSAGELDLEDIFAGLDDDLLDDEILDEPPAEGSLRPKLSPAADDLELSGSRTTELGDLSLDEGLDLDGEDEPLRPAILEEDLFAAGDLFGAFAGDAMEEQAPEPAPVREPEPAPPEPSKARKPARLKMNYRSDRAFVREYQRNMEQGSTFIKTPKPLKEGRVCLFEVRAPSLSEPLLLDGQVVWSSRKRELRSGEEQGMTVEYRMDGAQRRALQQALESAAR